MARDRLFVRLFGASVLVLGSSAVAQHEKNEVADRGVFRTLDQALRSGLFIDTDDKNVVGSDDDLTIANGGMPGDPDACVMDASCVQPNDNITGFNAAAFSTAETVTVGETGTINRFCAQFIFAPGGACPPTNTHPALTIDWTLDFFDVLPDGDVDESSLVSFDTDVLENMVVSVSDGGVFGGAFMITSVSMDLTTGGGMPVTAGQTIAINPQYQGLGGSCGNFFWASSSDVGDGTPSGDGQVLFDQSGMDEWSVCEYVEGDLMVCLDIAAGPPVASPDFSTPAANDECDTPTPIACDTTFVQCVRFATANTMTDPTFECETTGGLGNDFTGLHTVWYSVTPTSGRVRVDTCNLRGDPNFMLQVFRVAENAGEGVGPCDLILLACSDNDCRFGANVCMNDVVPGEELIVQVAAATSFDAVDLELTVTCGPNGLPPQPANDDCMNAEQLFANPMPGPFEVASVSGSTECASLDPVATSCAGTTTGLSPGVWYTAVGDGTMWLVSQCITAGGDFDSQMNVYCGTCNLGLVCLSGNDDSVPCPPMSEFLFCTELGRTYYIYVHGFFDVGNFALQVNADIDFLGGCTNDPTHGNQCLLCECGCIDLFGNTLDIIEETDAAALMEMCGQDVNSGCFDAGASGTVAPFIEGGALPFSACAMIFADGGQRDLDSYRWTITERSVVSISVISEFAHEVMLYDSDDCDQNALLASVSAEAGTDTVLTAILNPGTYVSVVTSSMTEGLPCGSGNDYNKFVDSEPLGACCVVDTSRNTEAECMVTTEADCSDLGGSFFAGLDCGPVSYDLADLGTLPIYASIVGLATEVVIDGDEPGGMQPSALEDEEFEIVDILGDDSDLLDIGFSPVTFPFEFYGEQVRSMAVTSNGYITMQSIPVNSPSPESIGTPGADGTANHFIAPLWGDLDPSAMNADVSVVLLGNAPLRTLMIEYRNVSLAGESGSNNSFQVAIFEGANTIRFLFNEIDDLDAVDVDGETRLVTIGLENQDGSQGVGLSDTMIDALSTVGLGTDGARIFDFTPIDEFSKFDQCDIDVFPGCPGDCDGSDNVNFGDLVAMLFEFGTPGSESGCDTDESGSVNFADLVAALFLFGPCPE